MSQCTLTFCPPIICIQFLWPRKGKWSKDSCTLQMIGEHYRLWTWIKSDDEASNFFNFISCTSRYRVKHLRSIRLLIWGCTSCIDARIAQVAGTMLFKCSRQLGHIWVTIQKHLPPQPQKTVRGHEQDIEGFISICIMLSGLKTVNLYRFYGILFEHGKVVFKLC